MGGTYMKTTILSILLSFAVFTGSMLG